MNSLGLFFSNHLNWPDSCSRVVRFCSLLEMKIYLSLTFMFSFYKCKIFLHFQRKQTLSFFFKSNLLFRHAHTASIKSALFALHVIASRHSNLESGLIMPLPLWILVQSACELRGNELILPVSAQGMVMLQTPWWGKCNEEAPEVDPALRIGFSLSANQGWDDFRLTLLQVNTFS